MRMKKTYKQLFFLQENKQNTEPINFTSNNELDITDESNPQIE